MPAQDSDSDSEQPEPKPAAADDSAEAKEEAKRKAADQAKKAMNQLLSQLRNNEIRTLQQISFKNLSFGNKSRGLNAISDDAYAVACVAGFSDVACAAGCPCCLRRFERTRA